MSLTIGIDASNIHTGGGLTHLIELLRRSNPEGYRIRRVIVWGSKATLSTLENMPWLKKVNPAALEGSLFRRILWQRFSLSNSAIAENCDVLFIPGGNYMGHFHPVVALSQNLLPFEWNELKRFGWALITLRLVLLRYTQSKSFQNADGVIFLTDYAKQKVEETAGQLSGEIKIIPHGLNERFYKQPREQNSIDVFSIEHPFRLLYVSIVDQYKHQWQVVEAVAQLRREINWPISLDLVGPAYSPALKKLKKSLKIYDPEGIWAHYLGPVSYNEIPEIFSGAEIFVFASSCENMPNVLLESMAAGLPIVCSNRGPMPDILRDGGVYFDPEQPGQITKSIKTLIESPKLRAELSHNNYQRSLDYSWDRCANQTFDFLAYIASSWNT